MLAPSCFLCGLPIVELVPPGQETRNWRVLSVVAASVMFGGQSGHVVDCVDFCFCDGSIERFGEQGRNYKRYATDLQRLGRSSNDVPD